MSQDTQPTAHTCAAIASLLPLARHNLLSAADASKLREHLAACADCRAQLATYDRVEAAWQRSITSNYAETPFLAQAELLSRISERASGATARRAASAPSSTPPALLAARRSRSRRFVGGLSALVACLLIAAIIGATFLARGHSTAGGVAHATPTKTSGPPYQNISDSEFHDISMVSANEGWAIGGTYIAIYDHTSDPGTLMEAPLLWHYLNSKWSAVPLAMHGQLYSISMDSPTDGWAIGLDAYEPTGGQNLMLHYDGHAWKQVSDQEMHLDRASKIEMISATDGWIIETPFSFSGAGSAFQDTGLWHYDGQTWKIVPLPASLNNALQQGVSIQVTGISMLSASEGWAVATLLPASQINTTPGTTPTPVDTSPSGVILHYTGGNWEVQRTVPKAYLLAVSMVSTTDGWIDGESDTSTSSPDPNNPGGVVSQDITAPLLLHYTQGQWGDATSSVNAGLSSIDAFLSLFMQSPTNGWLIFDLKNATNVPPSLLHYNGSAWNGVSLPTIKNTAYYRPSKVFMSSPTEGWMVGGRDLKTSPAPYTNQALPILYHFHNGVWSVVQS